MLFLHRLILITFGFRFAQYDGGLEILFKNYTLAQTNFRTTTIYECVH